MIRLDGNAIRQTRLDLGLSQRTLAKVVGLSPSAVVKLEADQTGPSSEITLPMLQRLVDTLGVPLSGLLTDDTPTGPNPDRAHAPDARPDDPAALGAVLLHAHVNTPKPDLADSLGWTLDRLRLAARALDHDLRPLGMHVHDLRGGYLLRPNDGYRTRGRTRVDRLTAARTGTHQLAAELIHRALQPGGLHTQRIAGSHRPHLSRLLRDGVLTLNDQIAQSGHALLDALDIPENPDP